MKSIQMVLTAAAVAIGISGNTQNVGINYDGSIPTMMLDVKTNNTSDGIKINNMAANGDPIISMQINNTPRITMGVDDSDADKFKIGTTAITTNTRLTLMTNGRFGVNTTTPGNLWHMTRGTTNIGASSMALFDNDGTTGVSLSGYNQAANNAYNAFEGVSWYGGTANTPAGVFGLHIYQSGAVNSPGIGVYGFTNEWQGMGVYGGRFNSGGANTGWGGVFVNDLGYTGFFGLFSDERLKENIDPMINAMDKVLKLNPVTFNYKTDEYPNAGFGEDLQYGFIAQEVAAVIPEAVRLKMLPLNGASEKAANNKEDLQLQEFNALDMTKFVPLLVRALQEQHERIAELEDKVERLNAASK